MYRILTIKEELQNVKAELSTFRDYVMADSLQMKQNNNERNETKFSASYEYHGR